MIDYSHMYNDFDDVRLIELSKNVYTCLRNGIPTSESRSTLAMKGMYATEELKDRGYEPTVQDLIADIAEQEGLFLSV